jgi:hypothetical protein
MRYPRPDKEYQSFSLIYGQRSLDLVCEIYILFVVMLQFVLFFFTG